MVPAGPSSLAAIDAAFESGHALPPSIVLVESTRDEQLYSALAKRVGCDDNVVFAGVGGTGSFREAVRTCRALYAKYGGRMASLRVGLIRDAGEDAAAAAQSARDALELLGLVTVMMGALAEAVPFSGGFYVVPEDGAGGVESLCWRSVETSANGPCLSSRCKFEVTLAGGRLVRCG